MINVPVGLPVGPYDVTVGPGARRLLPEVLPPDVQRVVVVTQPGIPVRVDPGVPCHVLEVAPGEAGKTLEQVGLLCREFARCGLTRADAVVAVGGGVVTDVAGLSASVFHRGMAYVNVATTLLAQVDAAIGGKTAVNLPEGKNLVGTFWQPSAVLCDTETLATLPAREWSSGRGEMAKYAFLTSADEKRRADVARELVEAPLEEQVARCVAIKASVVVEDERESGRRVILNYGHTLAHALEAAASVGDSAADLRHGEAVAIGLMFAAMLAARVGRIDAGRVCLHREVLDAFGLASVLPSDLSATTLVALMERDKKSRHDLTFVLDGPHGVEPVRGVAEADVLATLDDMGCAP